MDPSRRKVHARKLAEPHGGRITYAQLRAVKLTAQEVKVWIRSGELIRTRPRVYAVGYVRTDLESRLWEAILYAGPGAYLTGASGAYQLKLIDFPPRDVIVATARNCHSLPGIIVLQRRSGVRQFHNGMPVAPIPELMRELAATCDLNLVRKALANLDYRRQLDVAALRAACTRGRSGSAQLRRALERHLPQLAYANGALEVAFLLLLDAHHLAMPRVNVRVHGILVDAYWPELKLVVELDGRGNHGTSAQQRRDANSTEILRAHGLTVVRLSWDDVHRHAMTTVTALRAAGVQRV